LAAEGDALLCRHAILQRWWDWIAARPSTRAVCLPPPA
jgi:hypothetical protein